MHFLLAFQQVVAIRKTCNQLYALQQRLAQRDDLLNLRQQVRNQLHALVQHPEVILEVRARMDHIPSDLVVDSCHQMLRAAQPLISRGYTTHGRKTSRRIKPTISIAWNFTTKSGGV